MSIRIPKPVLFFIAFCLTLILYWPAMNGTPIWDDISFWFHDPVMQGDVTYLDIWTRFGWPFSVSLQKALLSIWGKNYAYYHAFNLTLHFANALLVYALGKRLLFKYPFIFFLLFLLHPVAVISTAWIIQIKTLLCFFFALSSLLCFLKGHKSLKWLSLSYLLFLLSVTSKSASITLPLLFLVISFKTQRWSRIYYLIPFFLISFWGSYRILKSDLTIEASTKASKALEVKEITSEIPKFPDKVKETPSAPVVVKEKIIKPKTEELPTIVATPSQTSEIKSLEEIPATEVIPPAQESSSNLTPIKLNFSLMGQTLYYYFWQAFLPMENAPVKGLNYDFAGPREYIHLFFLFSLVLIFRKDSALYYLLTAHFLLLPFLGIIPAPFMNITWVSDQHLYLVLPALIGFWMKVVEKIKWPKSYLIPLLFCGLFIYKTYKAAPTYENQISFYEKSLEYNPFNIAISYNLTFSYLLNGNWNLAYQTVSNTYYLADSYPPVKNDPYYPHLALLYWKMRRGMNETEN